MSIYEDSSCSFAGEKLIFQTADLQTYRAVHLCSLSIAITCARRRSTTVRRRVQVIGSTDCESVEFCEKLRRPTARALACGISSYMQRQLQTLLYQNVCVYVQLLHATLDMYLDTLECLVMPPIAACRAFCWICCYNQTR